MSEYGRRVDETNAMIQEMWQDRDADLFGVPVTELSKESLVRAVCHFATEFVTATNELSKCRAREIAAMAAHR